MTKKIVRPKGGAIIDYMSLCSHSPSFVSLSLLTKENTKFLLDLKETFLTMRDKTSLKRKIRSPPLGLFEK